jgi:mono/diheme cytochrome c family protein
MLSGKILRSIIFLAVAVVLGLVTVSWNGESKRLSADEDAKQKSIATGRDLILNHRFLPRDFHQATLDDAWQDWPEPLRSKAKKSTAEQRRMLAFKRYGFTPRPDDPTKSMQFSVDDEGWWTMNCFSCHGGTMAGKMIEGLPNSQIALETLYSDMRRTKLRRGEPFSQMDLGSMAVPMGTSNGTSNAVVFGIALMMFRDKDLNLKIPSIRLLPITHHDMDAPAWWNVSKRDRLYIDGFVQKNHRALIPFVMDQMNSGETMRGWEDEFKDVFAYIESLEPPKYPFSIDDGLVKHGESVFADNCASCHGTYGDSPTYPNRVVPIKKIGTDPVRLKALTKYDRRVYRDSWFAFYGADKTVVAPKGYLAPPLDGIWASGPYFHNGSVPTIEGVLDSTSRPVVWKRAETNYDSQRVGLSVNTFETIPKTVKRADEKRLYFDSTRRGKSNAGHTFGDNLTTSQRTSLLEYLKTL